MSDKLSDYQVVGRIVFLTMRMERLVGKLGNSLTRYGEGKVKWEEIIKDCRKIDKELETLHEKESSKVK